MKFFSTNKQVEEVGFKEAVIQGLPGDNGLYFPVTIPQLDRKTLEGFFDLDLPAIGTEVLLPYCEEDIDRYDLHQLLTETLNFPIPLKKVGENHVLELFHGPTLAFKDVGARFLARCLSHFSSDDDRPVTVLVATSGDTGSAVGQGFLHVPNVRVVILYPSGKVSHLQEQQLTTLGNNITALEIEGNFDDCQRLVKEAFLDKTLRQTLRLTSANSINIARWLPQSIYYFWAVAQARKNDLVFSVPSGNYGNLAAGLLAKAMGLPVRHFIAATNVNDVIPEYLATTVFRPRPSVSTISNAMDVGNPSNYPRLTQLYDQSFDQLARDLSGYSYTDEETIACIREQRNLYFYQCDPHGAVGLMGLESYKGTNPSPATYVFLETAHPAKFGDQIEETTGVIPELPERLATVLEKEKRSVKLSSNFTDLSEFLLQL